MMGLITSLYKDAKGEWDELAIGGHTALFGTLGATAFQLYHGVQIDIQSLGIGLAAILGSMGGGMRLRDGITGNYPPPVTGTFDQGSSTIPAEPGATGHIL